jgi:hypothetical protein
VGFQSVVNHQRAGNSNHGDHLNRPAVSMFEEQEDFIKKSLPGDLSPGFFIRRKMVGSDCRNNLQQHHVFKGECA